MQVYHANVILLFLVSVFIIDYYYTYFNRFFQKRYGLFDESVVSITKKGYFCSTFSVSLYEVLG